MGLSLSKKRAHSSKKKEESQKPVVKPHAFDVRFEGKIYHFESGETFETVRKKLWIGKTGFFRDIDSSTSYLHGTPPGKHYDYEKDKEGSLPTPRRSFI